MASLSLLEAEAPRAPSPWPLRVAAVVAILAVSGVVLYWQFRYYPEKKAVEHFMEALQAGDYQAAYRLWNAPPSYTFSDFLEDWGETTSTGRVRSYEIVSIHPTSGVILQVPIGGGEPPRNLRVSGDSSGVVVSVRINGNEPPVRLWVETDPPRLSFPPY